MADMVMSQAEISALKDTLCAQQQLLQKLYNELDAEREASATAASEALSMILRLQGEKAAVKMEAEQYKRLVEEKMCHAEESMAVIEDIIYQKEMEVFALDYQVQAYRYKLMSMGCVDHGVSDVKYPENLLPRNEALAGDTSSIGRRNSAPVSLRYKKCNIERERSISPEMDLILEEQIGQEMNDQASDSDKKIDKNDNLNSGSFLSYCEQMRKLDVKVREIAGANYMISRTELSSRLSSGNLCDPSVPVNFRNETRSPSPQISVNSLYESIKGTIVNDTYQTKHHGSLLSNGVADDGHCSPNVHDVFEVPQVDTPTTDKKKKARQGRREDSVTQESVKLHAKNESDWPNKLLQSTQQGKSLCKPSDIEAVDFHLAAVQPKNTVSESQPTSRQLNTASEIIEVERSAAEVSDLQAELKLLNEIKEQLNSLQLNRTPEIAGWYQRDEEMKLLNGIKEQLNSLHDEFKSLKMKKPSTKDEPSLLPLSEAMLHFWL